MMRRAPLACLFLFGVVFTASAQQDARIRLAPRAESSKEKEERWYAKPITTRIGEIVELDGRQLAVILSGEANPTRFPAERVLSIETREIPDDQRAALQAFRDGDYTTALKGLVASISNKEPSERPPVWRQQWLSMMAAQAAWRSGRGAIAFELIEQLDRRPMPPMIWALLPIDWKGTTNSQPLLDAAAKRAGSESLAVKLVAASWLLGSTKYRGAAESAINRLAKLKAPTISPLAKQLGWRSRTPVELRSQWPDWLATIDALPMSLQAGPRIAIESALRSAGLADAAREQKLVLETATPVWHPDLPDSNGNQAFPLR